MVLGWIFSAVFLVVSGAASDPLAIAKRLDDHYRDVRTLQAVFLERYIEGGQAVRVESGTVYFSRPGRMRWDYESPAKKLFLVDGRNVWLYVPEDRTATRQSVKQSEDWRTPLALLTGRVRLDKLCGKISLAAQGQPGADAAGISSSRELRCEPRVSKEEEPPFRDVLLEVDSDYRLIRVLIEQAGAQETEFRFGDWRENLPLPETLFHFAPPPGVAIIEAAKLMNGQQGAP